MMHPSSTSFAKEDIRSTTVLEEIPIKIDPTSMSDTCKVLDNLHMQWM